MTDSSDIPGAATELPVDPSVYVERYPSHASVSWQAGSLDQFLAAIEDAGAIPENPALVVDATNAAGQRRCSPRDIDTATGATTYVRADAQGPWTVSWERRTTPVVTITGTPTPRTCRRFHVATTECDRWPHSRLGTLSRMLDLG